MMYKKNIRFISAVTIFSILVATTACSSGNNISTSGNEPTNDNVLSIVIEEPEEEIDSEVFDAYSQLYVEKNYLEIIENSTQLDDSLKTERVTDVIADSISELSVEAQKKAADGKYGAALTLLTSSAGTLLDESYRDQWDSYREKFLSTFLDNFDFAMMLHSNTKECGVYGFIRSRNMKFDKCSIGGSRYCESQISAFNGNANFFLKFGHSDTNWFNLETATLKFDHTEKTHIATATPEAMDTGAGLGWVYEAITQTDRSGERLAQMSYDLNNDMTLTASAKDITPVNLCPLMHNLALSEQTEIHFASRGNQSHILSDDIIQEVLNTWAIYQMLRMDWNTFDEFGYMVLPTRYADLAKQV